MSNGQKQTTNHRNFMVDYRNAKYQGEVSDYLKLPNGTGMLVNIDYQLVISHWQEGIIEGPVFTLSPEGTIYYGNLRQNRAHGYNSYQISKHNFIYSYNNQSKDTIFMVDLQLNKSLTAVRLPEKEVAQALSSHRSQSMAPNQITLQNLDLRIKTKMEVISQYLYSNEQEKWELVAKITGEPVPPQLKNYRSFLKYHFNTRAPSKETRLELTQTNDYLQLAYQKAGIVCRIDDKARNEDRMLLLGYYDAYEEKCDVYRQAKKGIETEIHEFCQGHAIRYKRQRPGLCKTNLQSYYMKSTNFVNQFIPTTILRQTKSLYEEIFLKVEEEISTKNAQLQLQRGPSATPLEANRPRNKEKESVQTFGNFKLSEIKDEVLNRASRRKSSNKGLQAEVLKKALSVSQNQSPNSYQISQFKESSDLSPERSKYRDSAHRRSKEYLKYTGDSPSLQEKSANKEEEPSRYGRKKYSYLPVERNQDYSYSIEKNLERAKSNLILNDKGRDNYSPNSRYLNYSRTNHHNQSIKTLADNYQRIQEQLSQEKKTKRQRDRDLSPKSNVGTPNSRSPSRMSYLKKSGLSRGRRGWR